MQMQWLNKRYQRLGLNLGKNSEMVRQQGFTVYLGLLKKLLPKILTQVCLPETAKNCAACTQTIAK
jgi:hypothetical protein